MSKWFDDYQANLARIQSSPGAQVRAASDPRDAIYKLLQGRIQESEASHAEWLDLASGRQKGTKGGGFNAGDVAATGLNWAGRGLDILSRPNYAMANMFREGIRQGGAPLPLNPVAMIALASQGKLDEMLGSAWRGVSGQEKTTFSDVLGETGMDKGFGRSALGFAMDVGLDPTTYIGAGAVKGIVKGGFKAAGREVPRFRVKNVAQPEMEEIVRKQKNKAKQKIDTESGKQAATPQQAAADSIEQTGTAKVHDNVADSVIQKFNKPELFDRAGVRPFDIVPETTAVPEGLSNVARLINGGPASAIGTALRTPKARREQSYLIGRAAKEREARGLEQSLLEPYSARRYAEDVAIRPAYVTSTKKTLEKPVEVPVEKSGANEVIKAELGKLDPQEVVGNEIAVFGRTGSQLPFDIKTGATRKIGESSVKGKNAQRVHLKEIVAAAKSGEIPEVWSRIHIRQGGEYRKLSDYAKSLHLSAKTAELSKGVREAIPPKEVIKTTRRRMNVKEFAKWVRDHEHLDKEDQDALIAAAKESPDKFDEVVEQIKTKVSPSQKYDTLEDLQKAVDAGQLSKEAAAELKARLKAGRKASIESVRKQLTEVSEARATKEATTKELAGREAAEFAGESSSLFAPKSDILLDPAVAKETAEKVERAVKGEDISPEKARERLTEWQAGVIESALKKTNYSQFMKPIENKWTRQKSGVMTEGKRLYEGDARWRESWNQHSQMEVVDDLLEQTRRRVGKIKDPAARSAAMYDTFMPMLNAAEQTLRQNGIHPILGFGKYNQGIALGMHDILESLPREFVEKHFFDKPWKIKKEGPFQGQSASHNAGITQFSEIAEQFIRMGRGKKTAEEVQEALSAILKGNIGTRNAQKSMLSGRITRRGDEYLKETTEAFTKAFNDALPALQDKLTSNLADAAVKKGIHAKALTEESIAAYNKVIDDPTFSASDRIKAALEAHKFVDEAAYSRQVADTEAQMLAKQGLDAHIADTQDAPAIHAAETTTKKAKKAKNKNEQTRALDDVTKQANEDAKKELVATGKNVYDLGILAQMGLAFSFLRHFVPDIGQKALRRLHLDWNSAAQTYVKQHTQILSDINRKYTGDEIKSAWRQLRSSKKGDELTPAMQDLKRAMKDLTDMNESGFGPFDRLIHNAKELEAEYYKYGVPKNIRLDPENLNKSWRKWDTEDPLDVISRVNAAHTNYVMKKALGSDLSSRFGQKKWQPGLVKLQDKSGKSELLKHIDTDVYYPEDIAKQMHMLDDTMKELMKPNSSNRFLRDLDTVTHMWKAGVTIYRPGHHVRNFIGDAWFNTMDGVRPNDYVDALHIMATRPQQYKDFDSLRALSSKGGSTKPAKSVLSFKFNGEDVYIAPEQMYQLMHDSGALPTYAVLEDLALDAEKTGLRGFTDKVQPFKGRVHKFATGVSEGRDHYVRMAHFQREMKRITAKGIRGKDLDETLRKVSFDASSKVRKWHPDGSDLTKTERNVMRRVIPFYSWVRKAIPLVIETAVTRPGRTLVYPKAMYAWAEANGIDVQGYGNPFPTDQLFPSWIADSVQGPIFGEAGAYVGLRPGVPSADVMDEYFASPGQTVKTVAGSTHPALRIPLELLTQERLRTGGPIRDWSDYADQQIPMATYINQLMGGKSLTSGFTQDVTEPPSNIGWENENLPPGATWLRFFSGLDFPDMSKPSYIKNAQLELRDKLRG